MKEKVAISRFIEVFYDAGIKLYHARYLPTTRDMTDQEWRDQMIELKNLIEKYQPEYIIDDNRERLYGYSPEMQAWTLNLFTELWNRIGLKKYAQILPKEIIGKLTSMQIEEMAVNDFEMNYQYKMAEDFESAMAWIEEGM